MGELGIALIAGSLAGALKWKNKLPRVRLVAAILAGCSLAGTGFGQSIVSMIGSFGQVVLVILLIFTLVAAIFDLKDSRADWMALAAALTVPMMLLATGGAVGDLGATLVGGINSGTTAALSSLFGV